MGGQFFNSSKPLGIFFTHAVVTYVHSNKKSTRFFVDKDPALLHLCMQRVKANARGNELSLYAPQRARTMNCTYVYVQVAHVYALDILYLVCTRVRVSA